MTWNDLPQTCFFSSPKAILELIKNVEPVHTNSYFRCLTFLTFDLAQSIHVLPGGHFGTQCEAASALRRSQVSGGRALFGPDLSSLDEIG